MTVESWSARMFSPFSLLRQRRRRPSRSDSRPSRQRAGRRLGFDSLESRRLLSLSPAGPSFQVNTFTVGDQSTTTGANETDQTPSSVAVDADGDFVFTWQSQAQDGSGWGVYAQRYNAAGVPQGAETRVANTTVGDQLGPVIAIDADGDYVIAWISYSASTGADIYARRYNAVGVAQGNEFRVNSLTAGDQMVPSVAMDNDGDFVVIWNNRYTGSFPQFTIVGQRFNANGVPQGGEFGVDSTYGKGLYGIDVAMNAVGDFVVAWDGSTPDPMGGTYDNNVFARQYRADGTPLSTEFFVNTYLPNTQAQVTVAADRAGDFIVVWGGSSAEDFSGMHARKFSPAGVPLGDQFMVPIETTLDQVAGDIVLDAVGNFTVTWGGYGPQPSAPPYARSYSADGTPLGDQFTVGPVGISPATYQGSVASSAEGDLVFAWAAQGTDSSGLAVLGRRYTESVRVAPPTVAGVYVPGNSQRIEASAPVINASTQLVVSFSEAMSTTGAAAGANSVTNPANWQLTRNAVDVSAQITGVAFNLNPATNHWEATLTLSTPLSNADYVLTAKSTLRDTTNIGLDGDLNGAAGGAFTQSFSVALPPTASAEARVNTYTTSAQLTYAAPTRAVAADASGDYMVVWASNAQDGSGLGVYGQRYSAAGLALGSEFRVNTTTGGNQSAPSVASSGGGDFLVVWTGAGQDGSGTGVFAKRYNAAGVAVGNEFRVNTTTSGDQQLPSVAMDLEGNAVVAWTSVGQDGDTGGIYAQRFDSSGVPVGGEFRVNTTTVGNQVGGQVALDADGDFVVAWTSYGQDGSSGGIYAQRYSSAGAAQGGEFLVNTTVAGNQRYGSVAMDYSGDFAVAWQADRLPSGYGVYVQRYSALGIPVGVETPVDSVRSADQRYPSVTMAASGRMAVSWSSYSPDGSGGGVYAQQYLANGTPTGGVFPLNTATAGNQQYATLASDAHGNLVAVWTSDTVTVGDTDVMARTFGIGTDTTSPTMVGMFTPNNEHPVAQSDTLTEPVSQLLVEFSEDMSVSGGTSGLHSVTNKANWRLWRAGVNVSSRISGVTYAFNSTTRRYLATVTFTGVQNDGGYELQALPAITDVAGNALDGNADGAGGDLGTRVFGVSTILAGGAEFRANTTTAGNQATQQPVSRAVAMDALGNSVVVWASDGQDGSGWGVYGQRFDRQGVALGSEFLINATTAGNQQFPSVAMDADGDFVATWTSYGQDGALGGIYARRYDAAGVAQGSEFRVNTTTAGNQFASDIALDAKGNFVVSWTSDGQDGSGQGVYFRRYSAAGAAISSEVLANTFTAGNQSSAAIASDALGNFVVAWVSAAQDLDSDGVYAKLYNAAGVVIGSEFRVNTTTTSAQNQPAVGMNASGDFAVSWTSAGQDGGGNGVYAKRYSAVGAALSGDLLVNTTTVGNQANSSVALNDRGDAFFVWDSAGQDGSGSGVYFQAIGGSGAPFGGETRVNVTTANNQSLPKIGGNGSGALQVVWTSDLQDGGGQGVYGRVYHPNQPPIALGISNVSVYENSGEITTINLLTAFSDADSPSSALTYSVAQNTNAALFQSTVINAGAGTLTLNYAANMFGTAALTVRATDPQGLFVDQSFTVQVLSDSNLVFLPRGGEFRVNSVTAGEQGGKDVGGVDVAMSANGASVAAFLTPGVDANHPIVVFRRIDALGNPLGVDTSVADPLTDLQAFSRVAMDPAGDFVVTWSQGYALSESDFHTRVYARAFNPDGTPKSAVIAVDTLQPNTQIFSDVAMDAAGNFVVTWMNGTTVNFDVDLYARRFNSLGVPLGGTFQVNQVSAGSQLFPTIDMLADGRFAVTWFLGDLINKVDPAMVEARQFSAAGVALGGDILVAVSPTGDLDRSSIAVDPAGGFYVAWGAPGSNMDLQIFARHYNATGAPTGNVFQLNQETIGTSRGPNLAVETGGGLVAAWTRTVHLPQGGDDAEIYAQRFTSAGVAVGAVDQRINTYLIDFQTAPALTLGTQGRMLVAWNSNLQDGSGGGVYAQRLQLPTLADAGGPYTMQEGAGLSFDAAGSFDPTGGSIVAYAWDINGDGTFGDATGVHPTLTWTQLKALGVNDGPATFNTRVRVTDGAGRTADSPVAALTVTNAPPTAMIVGDGVSVGYRGELRTFTLSATDPSPVDASSSFTYQIDWDGNGSTDESITGPASGATATHAFYANGTVNVGLRAMDKDGGVSGAVSVPVTTAAYVLRPNALNAALSDLVWGGTAGDDSVVFTQVGGSTVSLQTLLENGVAMNTTQNVAGVTGRVIAYGNPGNDSLNASGLSTKSATLDGGAGNNTLRGGNGGDILIGGTDGAEGGPSGQHDGNNVIIAGNGTNTIYGNALVGKKEQTGGDNLIIGGAGADTIYGNYGVNNQPLADGGEGGHNIIIGGAGIDALYTTQSADGGEGSHGSIAIAGTTTYGNSPAGIAALQSILAEWSSGHTLSAKQAYIQGTGGPGGLNGSNYLTAGGTVLSDAAVDTIFGDTHGSAHWFFYRLSEDLLNRTKSDDILTTLP